MTDDVNDFLFGGGAKSFPWDKIGDICRGTVIEAKMRQQTAIDTNEPLTWADGRPRMQLVIRLQTDLHDNDDDDGQRTIYAKGGNYDVDEGEGVSMKDAIADAMKLVDAKKIEPGDELAVGFTGKGKAKRGFNAPHLYAANFKKGKQGTVSAKDLFGGAEEEPF
jgi:hypothetical protein